MPTSGTLTSGYSGLASAFYDPAMRKDIVARYGDDDDFCLWMDIRKAWNKADDFLTYTAFDSPMYQSVALTGSTVTNNTSALVTVTGVNSSNNNVLGVGAQVRWLNGSTYYEGRIETVSTTSITNDTFTVRSTKAGNPNIVIANTNTLYPFSNTQEEGSAAPPNNVWPLTTLTNIIQIFRKGGEVTDVARARNSSDVFKFKTLASGPVQYGRWDGFKILKNHRCDIGLAMLLSNLSDANLNTASPTVTGANGRGVNTTRGLVPTITAYGWNGDLASAGTWTTTDLENIEIAATARRAPMHMMMWGATAPIVKTQTFLKNLNSSGITSVRLTPEGSALDFSVERYVHRRTWDIRSMNTLDNQQVLPTTDPITKTLYVVPVGKVPVLGQNGKVRGVGDYVGIDYMPVIRSGSGDEKMAHIHIGALAEVPTNGTATESDIFETMAGLSTPNPYFLGGIRVNA